MRYIIWSLLCTLFLLGPAHAASTQLEDMVLVGRSISSTAQRARVRLHDGDVVGTREYIDITAPTNITTSYEVKLPAAEPIAGDSLQISAIAAHVATAVWATASGSGTVSGTGTDNHIARWDGTADIQDSGWLLDDSDIIGLDDGNTSLQIDGPNALITIWDTGATAPALTTSVYGDGVTRLSVTADGKHSWGDGTAAKDTSLGRSAANTVALGVDDMLSLDERTSPGSSASGFANIYAKSDGLIYGTDDAGVETKLSNDAGSSYTDEQAQDAVGTILTDTATIDFTYSDPTPSITADVKNDSVTYAKMQNISATDRLLGRDTAGAGDTEELTATGGIEFTGTGIQTSAFTGEVTKAVGGTVQTIANDAVVFARMQNIPTDSLIGRDTAGAGDPESITLGTGLAFSGSNTIVNTVTDTDTGITELTGNVTAGPGNGSQVATIANDAVTFARMQNINTDSLIGRDTAGSGDPENLGLNSGLTVSGGNLVSAWADDGTDLTPTVSTRRVRSDVSSLADNTGFYSEASGSAVSNASYVSQLSGSQAIGMSITMSGAGKNGIQIDESSVSSSKGVTIQGTGTSQDGFQASLSGASARPVYGAASGSGANGVEGVVAGTSLGQNDTYGVKATRVHVGSWADASEVAAPATPPANTSRAYVKSDGLWYGKDDAGIETKLSNAAAGIGDTVSSGSDNRVLFVDPAATLAQDAGFQFENATNTLTLGEVGSGGTGDIALLGNSSGTSTLTAAAAAGGTTTLPTVTTTMPTAQATTQNKYLVATTGGVQSYSSLNMGQTEVDWGTNTANDEIMSFTVTDATIASGQRIIAQVAYEAPSDKDVDELDDQPMTCMCVAGSGQFTLVMQSLNGAFFGKVKVNYTVGN